MELVASFLSYISRTRNFSGLCLKDCYTKLEFSVSVFSTDPSCLPGSSQLFQSQQQTKSNALFSLFQSCQHIVIQVRWEKSNFTPMRNTKYQKGSLTSHLLECAFWRQGVTGSEISPISSCVASKLVL